MSLTTVWPLVLFAVVPWVWWVAARRGRTGNSPGHVRLHAAVRALTFGLLALALTQPVWRRSGSWTSVIYVLDVSGSVSPASVSSAIAWIEGAEATGGPEHSRFVPFGANAFVLESLEDLRSVPVGATPAPDTIDQTGSNLEQALELAAGSAPADHLHRIVLFTDGNQNAGDVRRVAAALGAAGIPVFTEPLEERFGPDAWLDAIRTPPGVIEDELFPLEVHVYSQSAGPATVTIRDTGAEGDIEETREVELAEGMNRLGFELRSPRVGTLTLEGVLERPGDPFPENNRFRHSLTVGGAPEVLYIEGRPESARYLGDVLEREAIRVELSSTDLLPDSADGLDRYAAVILSDVRGDLLTPAQMDAVATYVSDLGGGLILAGGESVFGEDGYSESRIEEVLPVRFDLERDPPGVALIIVLDKSGSMGGQKLELAKEASRAAAGVLADDQLIGLVAFDYDHYWPFELQPAANRETIESNIRTIVAGGETNIYPALRDAHEELVRSEAEIKHVILLSDGRSLPADFRTLVEEMAEAGETLSTVAVGNGADRELLADMARWGTGRDYFIEDATRVPQVFTEETELATRGALREESFRPVVLREAEALAGIDFESAPPLLGYVATLPKDTAEILLGSDSTDDPRPILARWQHGLGKAVAFTSDVKDRWAVEWLDWEGYAQLWPQLVRETMRREDSPELDLSIEREGSIARIEVTILDAAGAFRNDLVPEARVVGPGGEVRIVDPQRAGPGLWTASFPVEGEGTRVVNVTAGNLRASRTLPYSYPEEYHLKPPDTELLAGISRVTGGRFGASAPEVFDTGGALVARTVQLWPVLAIFALVAYLSDLLLRRVQLFEGARRRPPQGTTAS